MVVAIQRTKVSSWDNSEAVRIPRGVLRTAGLSSGDDVDVAVNKRGNIELVPGERAHQRAHPARHVTYESLFADNKGDAQVDLACVWPDVMVGAEGEAWGL